MSAVCDVGLGKTTPRGWQKQKGFQHLKVEIARGAAAGL
jgi:hypothetical protein